MTRERLDFTDNLCRWYMRAWTHDHVVPPKWAPRSCAAAGALACTPKVHRPAVLRPPAGPDILHSFPAQDAARCHVIESIEIAVHDWTAALTQRLTKCRVARG